MKYLYLVLLLSIASFGFSQEQANNKLVEENKAYIEKLKQRIDEAEKLVSPEVAINKLKDSIAFLQKKIKEIEKKAKDALALPEKKLITVLFTPGSSKLHSSEIKKVNQKINNTKKIKEIFIVGYADSTGSRKKNLQLSKYRAENTKEFLQKLNLVKSENIYINWLGNTKPNSTRKVTITMVYED